jgi:GNAT superfamily N-acetyltransferase
MEILTDPDVAKVIAAMETNHCNFFAKFAKLPGAEIYQAEHLLWIYTGIQFPMFNAVLFTDLAEAEVDAKIAEMKDFYTAKGVSMRWCTAPITRPLNIGEHLLAQGFSHIMDSPGMMLNLADGINADITVPDDLEISLFDPDNKPAFADWIAINEQGYGFTPVTTQGWRTMLEMNGFDPQGELRLYNAYLNGEAVAAAALFFSGGVAGIYNVATLPQARGQGLGANLMLRLIQDAKSAGYHISTLQSSKMGFSVYRRLGYEQICTLGRYHYEQG